MLKQKQAKSCQLCDKPLKGRSDKKFCDDYCRAAYNNDLKSARNNYIRNVNNALGRNRRILESFLPGGGATAKANRDKLIERGFQFKYHTQQYSARNGNTYFYCYDYGICHWKTTGSWWLKERKNKFISGQQFTHIPHLKLCSRNKVFLLA